MAMSSWGNNLRNIATNLATIVVGIFAGIWFSPYLLNSLGVEAFGLISLSSNVVLYMSVLTVALNSSVGRHLTVALQRQEWDRMRRIFNTSFWGSIGAGLICLLLGGVAAGLIPFWLRVPAGLENQARMIMGAAVIGFCVTTVTATFSSSAYSRNRIDLVSGTNIVRQLTLIFSVLVFFYWSGKGLDRVAFAIVVASLVSTGWMFHFGRQMISGLTISPHDFDKNELKRFLTTGSWVTMNQLGTMLYMNIDLLVANWLFGPKVAGEYATAMLLSNPIRYISQAVSSVFGPSMTVLYAKGEQDRLVMYVRRRIKYMALFNAWPIGLICGFCGPLLGLWLKPQYRKLAPLVVLLIIHLSVNLSSSPLFSLFLSLNRVRWPGLVTLATGVSNLVLALVLAGPLGLGVYGIAGAGAITLTLRNLFAVPLYSGRVLGVSGKSFIAECLKGGAAAIILACIGLLLNQFLPVKNLLILIGMSVLLSVAYWGVVLGFLLSFAERAELLGRFRKFFPSGWIGFTQEADFE